MVKTEKENLTRKPLRKSTKKSILLVQIWKKFVNAEGFDGDAMKNTRQVMHLNNLRVKHPQCLENFVR